MVWFYLKTALFCLYMIYTGASTAPERTPFTYSQSAKISIQSGFTCNSVEICPWLCMDIYLERFSCSWEQQHSLSFTFMWVSVKSHGLWKFMMRLLFTLRSGDYFHWRLCRRSRCAQCISSETSWAKLKNHKQVRVYWITFYFIIRVFPCVHLDFIDIENI